jgi:adenylate kinase
MKQLILIIGAPGSGKTTDAQLIAQRHDNITHYSTGDMLRNEVNSNSEVGKKIEKYVNNGNLVPIEIVIQTIVKAIKNSPTQVVIIDGYPRSIDQMIELDKYLTTEDEVELLNVIEVEVSSEIACQRVLGRARGSDDNITVFHNRMEVYKKPLEDIQTFYSAKDILKKIDGQRTIEEIVEDMDKFILSRL